MTINKTDYLKFGENLFEIVPPAPSETERGGIIASPRTETDTVEAKIGEDGKLYVSAYSIADSEMSSESENPVQNKVITEKFNEISEQTNSISELLKNQKTYVLLGDRITLTVGKGINVGQVINFKYYTLNGYSIDTLLSNGSYELISISYNDEENELKDASYTVPENAVSCTFTGAYEPFFLGLEEDYNNKINELKDIVNITNNLVVNAKAYGLKGDGVSDDAPLFSALVSELNANGGGTIFLPNGEYHLGSRITWKSNVSLIGESYNAILKPYCDNSVEQGFAAISWLNTDGSQQGYNGNNPMVNCHFSNFTIDGINENPSVYDSYPKGINMHFLKDCTFEKINIINTYATGLGVDFLENVFIHNIYCYNCGRGYVVSNEEKILGGAGIGIGTMGMTKESCVISDCIVDGCGNYGIFLEGGSTFPEGGCDSHYTISNCQTINGRNYGIVVKGTNNVIVSNNIMKNNARDGFALLGRDQRHSENIQIVGNISIDNSGCGFRFWDIENRDAISKNIYMNSNTSSGNTKDGFLMSYQFENVFINNNIFKENYRGIAFADYDFTNVYFDNNTIINNTTQYVLNGRLYNDNKINQLMHTIYYDNETWENRIYTDDGSMNDNALSKTNTTYYYCSGSQKAGFYAPESYVQTNGENRAVYVQWFDKDLNFISRQGSVINNSGYALYTPPENATYVKFRIGLNKGTLTNEVLRSVECVIYMNDRNDFTQKNNNVPTHSLTLSSPNGTKFQITIGDDGVLTASEITE